MIQITPSVAVANRRTNTTTSCDKSRTFTATLNLITQLSGTTLLPEHPSNHAQITSREHIYIASPETSSGGMQNLMSTNQPKEPPFAVCAAPVNPFVVRRRLIRRSNHAYINTYPRVRCQAACRNLWKTRRLAARCTENL